MTDWAAEFAASSDFGETYAAYLASEEWAGKRAEALRLGAICRLCEMPNRAVEVHHRTYERVGDERLSDLIVVCRSCHSSLHKFPDFRREMEAREFARSQDPDPSAGGVPDLVAAFEVAAEWECSRNSSSEEEIGALRQLLRDTPLERKSLRP